MSQVNREELYRFFPETMYYIEHYIEPYARLNRLCARLMYIPLAGCILAIVWALVIIARLAFHLINL